MGQRDPQGHVLRNVIMFGIFKPITIKSDDFTIKLNLFEPRKEGKQTNFDVVHCTMKRHSDDAVLVDHLGIQGRSDHLEEYIAEYKAHKDKADDFEEEIPSPTEAVAADMA